MKRLRFFLKKQGFTLVELIIVIAIIAVLAVAAFMMLTKWLGKSRDSRRLSDLGTIARGLQVGYSDTDDGVNMYPTVKDQAGAIELLSGAGTIVGYQGVADNEVVAGASMQKAPQDPSDQSYYTYLVTQNRQKFQLLGFLEDGTEVGMLNEVAALEYANMKPTTKGFDLGVVLRESDNMPANLIGGGLTGVDMTANTVYVAVVNESDIRTGVNISTAPIVKEEVVEISSGGAGGGIILDCTSESDVCTSTDVTSCKYLLGGNYDTGIYWIDPDGSGDILPFKVYCDMDTDGGGWTLVANILSSYTPSNNISDLEVSSGLEDSTMEKIMTISTEIRYNCKNGVGDSEIDAKTSSSIWMDKTFGTSMRCSEGYKFFPTDEEFDFVDLETSTFAIKKNEGTGGCAELEGSSIQNRNGIYFRDWAINDFRYNSWDRWCAGSAGAQYHRYWYR